jgi:2'-5' RNA ligase
MNYTPQDLKTNLYTYLLILHPDESVNEKIMEQKKYFAKKYECPSCLYSKPHITLIKFFHLAAIESLCIRRINNFARGITPFPVQLNGFGSFPSHTIYFSVQTKNEIIDLVKSLRGLHLPLKIDKDFQPHFITEPHITLARKLLPRQFEQGWLQWHQQDFLAKFMVTEMTLLKRRDMKSKYQIVSNFCFEGKPEQVQQTLLF